MAGNDSAESARVVNVESGILGLVLQLGGGWLPPPGTGSFSLAVWAALLGKDETTVRRWVTKYKIPFQKPGDEMLIDAGDFRRFLPMHNEHLEE